MEEEQQSYRPLKTAKTFVNTLQSCFQKRDGDKLAKELKELFFTDNYSSIPEKSWNISINYHAYTQAQPSIGTSYSKVIQLVRDFASQRAGNRWSEAFDGHMQVLIAILKVLEDMKEFKQWISKSIRIIIRATKRIFLSAEKGVTNSSAAAKLKNTLLNTLQRFKSARALGQDIKRQFLPLIDVMQISILLSFHNYEQIQRIIYSPKIYGDVGQRYIDNFLFQKGKYALVNQNLKEAEECLSKIQIRTKSQKKLVLRYLIPCKMLLGRMFTPRDEVEKQEYSEYLSIAKSIISSDFKLYDELNLKYQKVWLKRGIYLLMDRVRILLWRNLVKRLSIITGNKIELETIEKAVKMKGGDQDINECVCIVGNLIYEGYIKGYIFQNQSKRTLVLKSSGNAFPQLASIAR